MKRARTRSIPTKTAFPCEGNLVEPGQFTADDFALLDALDAEQVTEKGDNYWGGLLILVNDKDPAGVAGRIRCQRWEFWTISGNTHYGAGPALHVRRRRRGRRLHDDLIGLP